ncbi:hypothetical protein MHH33_15725 [Paenisporosarcina sp. FSL H8-0542]|uniref:hypothetical protein n=1 Tax=Paenisporosarcina sp. FSL H8-0542 TaxID=2921401 RepID=UPI003159BF52
MTDPIQTMIQLLQTLIPLILGTILFSSTLMSPKRWLVAITLFIGISGPFIYSLFNEQSHPAIDANIGLGLSMLFVWICSGLLVLFALIRIYLNIKQQKN